MALARRRGVSACRLGLLLFGAVCYWDRSFVASSAQSKEDLQKQGILDRSLERREMATRLMTTVAGLAPVVGSQVEVTAAGPKTVVVAGATGQTGRRAVERLASMPGVTVIAGARDTAKAEKSLAATSVQIRGAMIDKVSAVDTKGVTLKKIDVVKDSVEAMAASLRGADSLLIATGFVPGNPFAMSAEARAVDNLGTKALVDAAKQAGVKKVVLVSSILTNGRGWGQENSPGFQITNAFGNVLDEKLEAEKYLRASGLDWTIVRPGGLKSGAQTGPLIVSGEDTLNNGEISRDLVADVSIAALFDSKASNRVVEIIEDEKPGTQKPTAQWFA
mmetsp:Transcript_41200/g.92523  ORF Transcript_41200/g.92523 Transcript_41200/m.92523 type:complete len:333 (+) Transcript_41200:82-1080(+)